MNSPFRGTGKNNDVIHIEWTYSGTTGQVTLDEDASDIETLYRYGILTPVVDSGTTGLTNITFPTCDRARVLHLSLEPATADISDPTDYRLVVPLAVNAAAGTMQVAFAEIETAGALADPNTGARARLTLVLDRS